MSEGIGTGTGDEYQFTEEELRQIENIPKKGTPGSRENPFRLAPAVWPDVGSFGGVYCRCYKCQLDGERLYSGYDVVGRSKRLRCKDCKTAVTMKVGSVVSDEAWFYVRKGTIVEISGPEISVLGRYKVFKISERNGRIVRLSVHHQGTPHPDNPQCKHWSARITIGHFNKDFLMWLEKRKTATDKPHPCQFSYLEVVGIVKPKAYLAAYYDSLNPPSQDKK